MNNGARAWRIEFETGDSLTTDDVSIVELHRKKGRFIVDLPADAAALEAKDEASSTD